MKVLKVGSKGEEVKLWQHFLIGQEFIHIIADGVFGERTLQATILFQKKHNLQPDGVVGNKTFGMAMLLGFSVVRNDDDSKYGPNWPKKPNLTPLVSNEERANIFGKFKFKHNPLQHCPENITILDDWVKENIIQVNIPQLKKIAGISKVSFNKKVAVQFQNIWKEWENNNLLALVLTWSGAFVPRFVRGSKTTLSNHSFGTAFDINYSWNTLGSIPALVGQKGTVRELVEIANANGFYWGGHFKRLDGMHFEACQVM
ncbi:MAG TPA: M15 family metallopeptidase [Candidatus Kapabacteria bacterium]|nr:M15 family metallopeptidase [Candidatus Kapabacteria bacterium]HPO61619.1 M15 family metallopeptidase [Candidatus Kapabacteria bacterium]